MGECTKVIKALIEILLITIKLRRKKLIVKKPFNPKMSLSLKNIS